MMKDILKIGEESYFNKMEIDYNPTSHLGKQDQYGPAVVDERASQLTMSDVIKTARTDPEDAAFLLKELKTDQNRGRFD